MTGGSPRPTARRPGLVRRGLRWVARNRRLPGWRMVRDAARGGRRAEPGPDPGSAPALAPASLPDGWVLLVQPGATLAPDARMAFGPHADAADVLYADNACTVGGAPHEHRRGAFSPALLLATDDLGPAVAVRASLLDGPAMPDGPAGRHGLLLRLQERGARFAHVRRIVATASAPPPADPGAAATAAAVQASMGRRGLACTATPLPDAPCGRPRVALRFPDEGPAVTIVIPTKDRLDLLRACVASVLAKTSYKDHEVLVVDNESREPATLAWLAKPPPRVRVVRIPNATGRFNYADLHNRVLPYVRTPWMLMLNNDTEVLAPGWLSSMMGHASLPGVGAVGARLLYPDGTVQHAGVLVGMDGGYSWHAFPRLPAAEQGYGAYATTTRDASAVTAACLLVRTDTYRGLGGLDAERFGVAYNDVDFCLRLRAAGLRVVWCAEAELVHHESVSRGPRTDAAESAHYLKAWGHLRDPFYPEGMALDGTFTPARR